MDKYLNWRLVDTFGAPLATRKRLPIHFPAAKGESLYGYLIRLAGAYGYSSPGVFWRAILHRGKTGSQVSRFARSLGLTPGAIKQICAPTPSYVDLPAHLHGLVSQDFNHVYIRWCPACLADTPWLRAEWSLKLGVVCLQHRCLLHEVCPVCRTRQRWERGAIDRCECGAKLGNTECQIAEPGLLELAGAIQQTLADQESMDGHAFGCQLSLQKWTRLVRYLGQYAEGDLPAKPGKISGLHHLDGALRIMRGTVALLGSWPNGFYSRLETLLAASGPNPSIRRTFGSLYRTLYHDLCDHEFQFLRDAFEDYLHENWWGVLCRRHRAFRPNSLKQPNRIGLTPFAKGCGLGGTALRTLIGSGELEATQVELPSGRRAITLTPLQIDKASGLAKDRLNLRSACELLGLRRRRVLELIGGDILHPLQPHDKKTGTHWFFSKRELASLLDAVHDKTRAAILCDELISLGAILQFWQINAAEFVALIRALWDGLIPGQAEPNAGLCDTLLDKSAMRIWLVRLRAQAQWLSIEEAAQQMGLKQQVAYGLVRQGFLRAEVQTKGPRAVRRISQQCISEFEQSYVSLAQLASQQGLAPKVLLAKLCVKPVTGPSIDGSRQYFYRRVELVGNPL